jgi:GntR family transcriptional repressor for pyruvate dehydrogenase complex
MEYAPIRRDRLSEEVADRLLAGIVDGKFELGERLPPERELVRLFEVGRPTIREALRVLSVLGVLEVRSGEGTFIVRRHADFIAKAFRMALLLDRQSVADVVDVRIAIECERAGLAAVRATPEERERLGQLVDAMERALGDSAKVAELDLEFHLAIAAAARNLSLSRLLDGTRQLLKEWIARVLMGKDAARDALEQHRAVHQAILDGDPEAARAAMRAHLMSVGDRLLATLSE